MTTTSISTRRAPDVRHLLGPAEALAAACRHGAAMISDGEPVAESINEDADALPKLVAQVRNARTQEKALQQIEKLLICLQRLSTLFIMSQNYRGLDELTLAVIDNEIRLFRDKVERVRVEMNSA